MAFAKGETRHREKMNRLLDNGKEDGREVTHNLKEVCGITLGELAVGNLQYCLVTVSMVIRTPMNAIESR